MSRRRIVLLGALLCLLVSPAALSKIYKWIDAGGTTHYSQQPPPSGARTIIQPQTQPPAKSSSESASDSKGDNATDTGAASGDQQPETMADFCRKLRKQRQVLASNRPVRIRHPDDTLTPLDKKQRSQRLEDVQSQISQNCQGD